MTTKKILVLAIVTPIVLGVLGVGGYYGSQALMQNDAANNKDLEKFGLTVLPKSPTPTPTQDDEELKDIYKKSTGVLGATQEVATFADDKLSPTQKVIKGLMNDKDQLVQDKEELYDEIAQLKAKIAELEEYKRLNEHFAPDKISEELAKVKARLKKNLLNSPSAARFNNRQIDIVSSASAVEYDKFIRRNRLILSDFQREELVNIYLPEFAFCLGDGVDIAANSAVEERDLVRFFETQDISILKPALRQDLDTVLTPCQEALHEQLSKFTPGKA
ncbi:hypothetical protein QKW35_16500 [Pontibacterium granulatum]|uniref:hypothetical protein n=1 Tax=Pontibacterium granulatum TaxID=2036029 RepID=UPI00249B6333|nr:hypothetical protein [Pontibacterium granulatum]MDI3325981.1 hypothetical protein [Pontibacterium granulatum]